MKNSIGTWTYTKGELLQDRIFTKFFSVAIILGVIISILFVVTYFVGGSSGIAKLDVWVLIIMLVPIWLVLIGLSLLMGYLYFLLYKSIRTPKPEAIYFAIDKITTDKKEQIVNDEEHTLTEITLVTKKTKHILLLKGIKKNGTEKDTTYNYQIDVPWDELTTANKVLEQYKNNILVDA
jgi:hypothetical protein